MLRFVQIMSRRKPALAKLINTKLINDSVGNERNTKVLASTVAATTSQYFSPKKTRNKIKIEYDQRISVKSESKQESNNVAAICDEIKVEKSHKPIQENRSSTVASAGATVSKKPKGTSKKLDPEFSGKSKKSHSAVNKPKIEESEIKVETDTRPIGETNCDEANEKKFKRGSKNANPSIAEVDAGEIELKKSKWEPKNWMQTLQNMRKMRKDQAAPVDTMGCHKCHDPMADEKTKRYHILVALMLSSQTKDQTTFDAMNRLKEHGLTPENIVKSDAGTLEKLIAPVSFYKNKTKYLQKASQILIDQHSSDIPSNIEGLLKLPGVGPKMAHICMNSAWHIVTGIGVDTHVHRISNRLRWVEKPTKEPEQTRAALEKWLPFEYWTEVNEMMVGFGQTICTPINPKCHDCLNIECPARNVKK